MARVGVDLSKRVFQVHAVDRAGRVVLAKAMSVERFLAWCAKLPAGCHAGGNAGRARLQPQQWLVIQWPADEPEPTKYWLSTLPENTPLSELVAMAHQRWRIERDYQDLKQEFGLGHYEGRGWRGFHHHASLCIAAYGFLMAERLTAQRPAAVKKTASNARRLPFPQITSPVAAQPAQRHVTHSIPTLRH